MSVKSRRKGASGEREVAKELGKYLTMDLVRNLSQSREGGADILFTMRRGTEVQVEVKRRAKPIPRSQVIAWLNKLEPEDGTSFVSGVGALLAGQPYHIHAVAHRSDRQPWSVTLRIRIENAHVIATVDLVGFAQILTQVDLI